MAADPRIGRLVLFSGGAHTIFDFRPHTWVWDGAQELWIPQPAAGPEMRVGGSMAYDPVEKAPFLFGGLGEVKPCTDLSHGVGRGCGGNVLAPNQWLDDSWHYVRKP